MVSPSPKPPECRIPGNVCPDGLILPALRPQFGIVMGVCEKPHVEDEIRIPGQTPPIGNDLTNILRPLSPPGEK